jgi:hypothetical protein
MSDDRPTRETMSLEEATVSTMWEVAELVEVLERLGGIIETGHRVAKGTTH